MTLQANFTFHTKYTVFCALAQHLLLGLFKCEEEGM